MLFYPISIGRGDLFEVFFNSTSREALKNLKARRELTYRL